MTRISRRYRLSSLLLVYIFICDMVIVMVLPVNKNNKKLLIVSAPEYGQNSLGQILFSLHRLNSDIGSPMALSQSIGPRAWPIESGGWRDRLFLVVRESRDWSENPSCSCSSIVVSNRVCWPLW